MKRAKPKVKAVKMWAIFENGKISCRNTIQLFKSARQANAVLRKSETFGGCVEGFSVGAVRVHPLGKEK